MNELITDSNSIDAKLIEFERRLLALEQRSVEVSSLDELSDDMGEIRAGLFIAGTGSLVEGNLSGVAMMYPPLEITIGANTYQFSIVGCNNGILQFGISAVNGQAVFAGGDASIGADGIEINKMGYLIRHTATDGIEERVGSFGMWAKSGGTSPCYGFGLAEPGAMENVTNGDAETGDLTGWIASGDWSENWEVSEALPFSGLYSFKWGMPAVVAGGTGILTSENISVSENAGYIISCELNFFLGKANLDTVTFAVKWYDATDSLLRTDSLTKYRSGSYQNCRINEISPAGSSYANIVFTCVNVTNDEQITVYIDNVSFKFTAVNSQLYFDSDGKLKLNGNDLVPDSGLFGFNQMRGYNADGTEMTAGVDLITSGNTKSGILKQWGGSNMTIGSYWIAHVLLAKGTYKFSLSYNKAASLGKIDLYIDGVKQNTTSVDMYSATAVYDSQWNLTGIAIVSDGIHEIKFKADEKNSSSSAYGISGNVFGFYRTD